MRHQLLLVAGPSVKNRLQQIRQRLDVTMQINHQFLPVLLLGVVQPFLLGAVVSALLPIPTRSSTLFVTRAVVDFADSPGSFAFDNLTFVPERTSIAIWWLAFLVAWRQRFGQGRLKTSVCFGKM